MKQINTHFIIYLVFSLVILNSVNSVKVLKKKSEDAGTNVDVGKLVGECVKGLVKSIPPAFCWKKGADFGIIPTGCPNGYFRSLALCYEHCKPNYRHVLGVCWEDCPRGFADWGLVCFKFLQFRGKGTYIPRSLTNFSHEVPCPNGMYRMGALCYRNCANIQMENCGIGACVSDQSVCASTIINMAVSTLQSVADSVLLIVSLGSSSSLTPSKKAITEGIKKLGQQGLKSAIKSAVSSIRGKFQKQIFDKAFKEVRSFIKDSALGTLKSNFVSSFCSVVYEDMSARANTESTLNLNTVVDTIDVFNVKGIINGCKNTSDGGLDCAKNVLTGLSTLDPTGILGVATAFMHPECDVPAREYVITPPPVEVNEIPIVGNCKSQCNEAINNCINAPVNKGFAKECEKGRDVCLAKCNNVTCYAECEKSVGECIRNPERKHPESECLLQKPKCNAKCDANNACFENCEKHVQACIDSPTNKGHQDLCRWDLKPKCYRNCFNRN